MKTCTKCMLPKELSDFVPEKRNKDGRAGHCRDCEKKRTRAKDKKRYWANPERYRAKTIKRRQGDLDRFRQEDRDRYWADPGRARSRVLEYGKRTQYRARNQRYRTNLQAKLADVLRARMNAAIKRGDKAGSAVRDLGCTIPELKAWLEAKFHSHSITGEAMSWDNYGLYGWHIDHKRPLNDFDLTDREQFLAACHYTNLQPLWAIDNLKKGARSDWQREAA